MRFKKWRIGKTPAQTLQLTMDALNMDIEELCNRGALQRTHVFHFLAGTAPLTRSFVDGLRRAIGERTPMLGRIVDNLEGS